MYKGAIVSEDGTATIIIFSLYDDANIQALANTVKEKTESLHLPEHIYYAGSPMMITSIAHLISADLNRLLPIAFLLIAFVLFLGFRSLRGTVLPLLTAIIAIIWVIGIMALMGSEMSMVSNNIPIVLLAVGTAYAIHVLNRIDQVKENLNKAIIIALTSVTDSCYPGGIDHHYRLCIFHFRILPYHDPRFWNLYGTWNIYCPGSFLIFCSGHGFGLFMETRAKPVEADETRDNILIFPDIS